MLKKVIQSFNQLKKSIKNWEIKYVLSSKINGKISYLNYWNKNQTVNQGDLVFTIIPSENSAFIAKLKTPAQNIGKVKIGQQYQIAGLGFGLWRCRPIPGQTIWRSGNMPQSKRNSKRKKPCPK